MMHWGWGITNAFGIGGFFMMFIMIVFWGLIIAGIVAGIVLAVRALSGTGVTPGGTGQKNRALEVLQERYAMGEIDKDEYESKKRDLLAG